MSLPFTVDPDYIRCTPIFCWKHKVGGIWCHKHGTLITRFRPRSRQFHRVWLREDPFGQWVREHVSRRIWPHRNCPSKDN